MPDENPLFSFSPAAVIHLFNNALSVSETKKIIRLKGVYCPGRGQNYNGNYYDLLKDESSDAYMTLVVAGPLRQSLIDNKTIEFIGFISKKIVSNGAKIELQANMMELISQTQGKYSEEDIEKFEIQQAKALKGYRDVDGFLKSKLINGEKPRISVIIGRTGIIDSDIKHQLEEAIAAYEINFIRVNLSSDTEIITILNQLENSPVDVIVMSRGGGDNLEVFNRVNLARQCLNIGRLFVTAIGHKEDVTLVQKIADKSFITPTALGQFLNDLYNETKAMLEGSKAKLVEDITKNLTAGFEKQVQNLSDELTSVKKMNTENIENIKKVNTQLIEGLKSEIRQKENVIKQVNELANTYKADAARAKRQPGATSDFPSWLIIVVIIIIIVIAVKTC